MSTRVPSRERVELLDFFRIIFGTEPGLARLAIGNVTRDNRLANFQDHFFNWPEDAHQLVEFALDRRNSHDVYFSPRLRSERSGRMGTALPGWWLFADLDEFPQGHQAQLLDTLRGHGAVVVASGSPDRQHVYVPLDQVQSVEVLGQVNRRLCLGLGADAAVVQDNAILRVPRTFNHKGTLSGGRRRWVRLLSLGEGTPLDFETLDRLLPALPVPVPTPAEVEEASDWDGTIPERLTRLQEEYADKGDRSERTYAFVMTAIEAGVPYEDVVAFAEDHQPTADRGAVERHVQRIFDKHPHLATPAPPCRAPTPQQAARPSNMRDDSSAQSSPTCSVSSGRAGRTPAVRSSPLRAGSAGIWGEWSSTCRSGSSHC